MHVPPQSARPACRRSAVLLRHCGIVRDAFIRHELQHVRLAHAVQRGLQPLSSCIAFVGGCRRPPRRSLLLDYLLQSLLGLGIGGIDLQCGCECRLEPAKSPLLCRRMPRL